MLLEGTWQYLTKPHMHLASNWVISLLTICLEDTHPKIEKIQMYKAIRCTLMVCKILEHPKYTQQDSYGKST